MNKKKKKMTKQLSKNRANCHVVAIAIFHLISGVWELLIGVTTMESTPSEIYFLLDAYRNYLAMLSVITFFIGILLLLLRFNFARTLAIILAWWNLFTIPIINIWWPIYSISVKKLLVTDSWFGLWAHTGITILIVLAIRIYIIHMLNISRAGRVFLKETKNVHPRGGQKSG